MHPQMEDEDDNLETRQCIVCGDNIGWDKSCTLPPACFKHDYEEVVEAAPPVTQERVREWLEEWEEERGRILTLLSRSAVTSLAAFLAEKIGGK